MPRNRVETPAARPAQRSSSTSTSAWSAAGWPASPSRSRWRGAAGRSRCWKRAAIAWNASGRNAGFVLPGFAADPQALIDKVGRRTPRRCGRSRRPAPNTCGARSAKPACRASSSRRAAGCTSRRPATTRTMADHAELLAGEFGAAAEFWPGRARSRAAAQHALFQRHPFAGRLRHQPAQLCARSCRRGGSRGRAHLRGDAGAGDRSGGRAQAHHHAIGAGARRTRGAGRQRAHRRPDAGPRRHAGAGLDLLRSSPRRSASGCATPSAFAAR